MRRMITAKQVKGLEKLNDNIVINDDGTIMEVGGNIAVESIEQLGSMVDVEGTATVENGGYYSNKVLGTFTGTATSLNQWTIKNGNPSYPDMIDLQAGEIAYSNAFTAVYWKDTSGNWHYAEQGDSEPEVVIKFTGFTKANNIPESAFVEYVPAGKQFKPFFTEEQYQALLALIENA